LSYDFKDIQAAALGQWAEILPAFGIEFRPNGKNGPCPLCGGTDRAHWKQSAGKVLLYCRSCGTTWADAVLLDLAFNNNFADMCQTLGDWLHCQPSDRTQQREPIKTFNNDLLLAKPKIEAATAFAATVEKTDFHPILMRYGIGADCHTSPTEEGALFPLMIAGQVCDWLAYGNNGQRIISGQAARGSRVIIKPKQPEKNTVFVTPCIIDAHHLFQASKMTAIVACCADLNNLIPVCDSLPKDCRIVVAVPHTLDALDVLQDLPYEFVVPDVGRKFREIDYSWKPSKIHPNSDAGTIYTKMLDLAN